MKRVAIATLGCKTNQFESAAITEQFVKAGFRIVPFTEAADIYVINSCTVTARTDSETRRLVRRARRLNAEARIVATGCYAQVSPDELATMPEVDVVLGNSEKLDSALLTDARGTLVAGDPPAGEYHPLQLASFAEHTRAFLQVQNGCNTFCAYCIVPYARGRSRSVPLEEVLEGIRRLTHNGFKEVVLTGIHLGGYGFDLAGGSSLEGLVRAILKETDLPRLRIGSVDPNEFSDELIAVCADSPRICRHFHIPLQSGCDRVLQTMGRPYSTEQYAELLRKISGALPDTFIGTDIIAGFPGETEGEFLATCRFVETLPLADMHVFPYSRRPKTRAAEMPGQIPPGVIKERAALLRETADLKKGAFLRRMIGKKVKVLVQQFDESHGMVRGISDNYLQAEFSGDGSELNQEFIVTVRGVNGESAICEGETPGEP